MRDKKSKGTIFFLSFFSCLLFKQNTRSSPNNNSPFSQTSNALPFPFEDRITSLSLKYASPQFVFLFRREKTFKMGRERRARYKEERRGESHSLFRLPSSISFPYARLLFVLLFLRDEKKKTMGESSERQRKEGERRVARSLAFFFLSLLFCSETTGMNKNKI